MKLSEQTKGSIALLGLAFSYALFGVFTRFLAEDYAIFQQIYLRLSVALFFGALIFARRPDNIKFRDLPRRDIQLFFVRAIATYTLGVAPYIYAVTHTTLANVAFISALPAGALWGALFFKERLTPARASLIGTALLGVVLISVNDLSSLTQWGEGEVCALIGTLFFMLGIILVKKQSPHLPESALTQYFLIFGFYVSFICSMLLGEPLWFPISWQNTIVTLFAGTLITFNVLLGNYGFKRVPAMLGGNILTMELAFILILGFLIYDEVPTTRATCGGAVIVASVLALAYLESRSSTLS